MGECNATGCGCGAAPASAPVSIDTASPVAHPDAPTRVVRYRIANLCCPVEERLIRTQLAPLPEVLDLSFDLLQRTLTLTHRFASLESVEARLHAIGMPAQPLSGASDRVRTALHIAQLDCPVEERLIRDRLSALPDVEALEFNLLERCLTVTHTGQSSTLLAALADLGFTVRPLAEPVAAAASPSAPVTAGTQSAWVLPVAGVCAVLAEVAHWLSSDNPWPAMLPAALAILLSGRTTYRKGWIALRHRNLNINALMSIAVTGALLIGEWPEAAMVMVLFAVAERIEARSLDRARQAIHGLLALAPDTAHARRADGTWQDVPAREVALGTAVRLRPGERVALDGVVTSGRSAVDQAPITGESLPVDKGEGDPLFAGTINGTGALEYRVTAVADQSTLARIIRAIETAQARRAPLQHSIDRFAQVYTPVVLLLAALTAVLPPLLLAGDWHAWLYKALVLLVIACPCALVISTPVTLVSGLAAAARQGILVKGGLYLEQGCRLTTLAFDKTGTLTHGTPVQTDCIVWQDEATQVQVQALAAGLAAHSDHPLSRAIAGAAHAAGIVPPAVVEPTALIGRGVHGRIGEHRYHLGNYRLIETLGLGSPALEARLSALERAGQSVVLLADPERVLGLFAVADTLRETSREAIRELHALGVQTLLLSGDNPHTAAAIARSVGIDHVQGGLLPEDKLARIEALLAQGKGTVGMVGDGINDAPALARADIGFAMGAAGTDTAIETADVALMDDDLRKIAVFVRLSRSTLAILWQNIALALGIKAVFLLLALGGQATLWMAVFADVGTSLLVVANGLRLLYRPPRRQRAQRAAT